MPADLDIHVIMDNDGTHKTRLIRNWFAKRPRWHVHFTPTSASWINQVERFFALLTERALRRGVFRWTKSPDDILASNQRFCLRTIKANP